MATEHFVGRQDAVQRLKGVLTDQESKNRKLNILSIAGSGGIGKTYLFDHVLADTDLSKQKYMILRIDGNNISAEYVIRSISSMTDEAMADAIQMRSLGYYFPQITQVSKVVDRIRTESEEEFRRRHPNNDESLLWFRQFFDKAIAAGKAPYDVVPITRRYFDAYGLERNKQLLEDIVPTLISLRRKSAKFWEKAGLGTTAYYNSLKQNTLRHLAKALISDLSAILVGYQKADRFKKITHGKVKGINRLLFIIDDYEKMQHTLGEFLIGYLLPALRTADFNSTIILLGRDQLQNTHPAWGQNFNENLLEEIQLKALSQLEMGHLVENYGVCSADEKEQAWRDTQGYPFYVHLWIEEAKRINDPLQG